MVDFVKLDISHVSQELLLDHPLLDFKQLLSRKTGELEKKRVAEYKKCKFILYESGFSLFQGSLHYYSNEGLHNFDDFTFSRLFEVLLELNDIFKIDPEKAIVQNVEFGVNITPPTPVKMILRHLMLHKNSPFKNVDLISGDYFQVRHQRYFLKCYDKKAQFKDANITQDQIFRFEIKYIKTIDLVSFTSHKKGHLSLYDLLDHTVLENAGITLNTRWDEILLFDSTIDKRRLIGKERSKLSEYSNSNFWKDCNKQKKSRELRLYQDIVKNNSKRLQEKISVLIDSKWRELIGKSKGFRNQLTGKPMPQNRNQITLQV